MGRPASDWQHVAQQKARKYGLDPNIFTRQIRQESGFNPNARSPAGAIGIAQIMPATARGWGVNPRDPNAALDAAARHMAQYVKQFGSYKDALVAYNAGPGRVGGSLPAETQNYIKTILGGRDPGTSSVRAASTRGSGGSSGTSTSRTRTTTTTTPGVDNSRQRALVALNFLGDKNADVLDFASQIRQLQDIAPTTSTQTERFPGSTSGSGSAASGGDGSLAQTAAARAAAIDQQRLPYRWGGGHGGQTKITDPVPLDCSGAVSKVLGINPRVSGEFGKWGRPGDGGNRGVTVYSNGHHVLMKINGHFFGTSATNPGGGAGWIPQGAISKDYLRGFTARHSNR